MPVLTGKAGSGKWLRLHLQWFSQQVLQGLVNLFKRPICDGSCHFTEMHGLGYALICVRPCCKLHKPETTHRDAPGCTGMSEVDSVEASSLLLCAVSLQDQHTDAGCIALLQTTMSTGISRVFQDHSRSAHSHNSLPVDSYNAPAYLHNALPVYTTSDSQCLLQAVASAAVFTERHSP